MIDRRIRLIPNRSTNQLAELEAESTGPLLACDFYVEGVEQGREVPGGYEVGRLVNLDHHAPTQRMERMISSANLAIERIAACGPAAAEAVARGAVRYIGTTRSVAVGVLEHALDGELFPALLPEAVVIMLAVRRADDRRRWDVKLRLGAGAPAGFSLHRLALRELDPGYGGRWNAGSNRRGGGTSMPPERWAAELARRVERARGG